MGQVLKLTVEDALALFATCLIIEHNLDVIKTADRIVDLGPESGAGGGEIVATGSA